jgi:PAS domain S-box-containing protein
LGLLLDVPRAALQEALFSADVSGMSVRIRGRGVLRDRRFVIALSVTALGLTLLVSFFSSDPQTVGPVMLLPWVALLAFEVGPLGGLAVAVVSFSLFVASASSELDLTAVFVVGRLASFLLIGLGLGVAGARLRDSERRSRRLVEGLPLAMYTEDSRGLTYISPQIEWIVGIPAAAWVADRDLWRNALHSDDRGRVLTRYSAAVASGDAFECEYRLVGPGGRTVWVRDSSACVEDRTRPYRQGFIVDITEQKENEHKLERNATLMRGLIDRTVDGIALTDRDGRIAITNEPLLHFARDLGIPNEGLIHERLLAIAQDMADPQRYEQRMRELAVSPDADSLDEFEVRDSRRAFQGFTRAVISDGEYLGRVWTLREVTQERQVERFKDALLATVSHELRTPLTSIIGYLELIGTGDTSLGEEDAKYIEVVQRNASRLRQMVDDLLFLARVDAGTLSLNIATVDLVQAAGTAIHSARPLAETKEITLDLDDRSPVYAQADEKRIGQVLDNLISNAIKFTPAGGQVRVSIIEAGGEVVVAVSDTGCGIPESEQQHLFHRFFRSSSAAHVPGTGLGLAIVKGIVEGHGGTIGFESTEKKGTTITFSLPTAVPAPRPRALEPSLG